MPTRIFVTGAPGVGKSTAMVRTVEKLRARKVPVAGFWTEEIRNAANTTRVGFDIVSFDGARIQLARKGKTAKARVGAYGILVENMDKVAGRLLERLPLIAEKNVIVIDEVGPMELHSEPFRELVKACMARAARLLCTVKQGHDPLGLLRSEDGLLFEMTRTNRDLIPDEIVALLAA